MLLLLLVAFVVVPYLLGQLPELLGGVVGSEPAPSESATGSATSSWTWETLTRTTGPASAATATPDPRAPAGAPGATSTPAGPAAYPTVTITGRACPRVGTGPYAGVAAAANTSCAFATATQRAYLASGANGAPIALRVHSSARGALITLNCSGSQPVSCVSADGAAVYLYGGRAVRRS